MMDRIRVAKAILKVAKSLIAEIGETKKYFVLGVRGNPQLKKCYYIDYGWATGKEFKNCISVKCKSKTRKFSKEDNQYGIPGCHFCLERDSSSYGSVEWLAFESRDGVERFLRKNDYNHEDEVRRAL